MTDTVKETKEAVSLETLKAIVKPHVTIDKDGNVDFKAAEAAEEAFKEIGISKKEVKRAYDAVTAFNNAARVVIGEEAIDVMAKNKSLEEISVKYRVGGEKVSLVSRRTDTSRNPTSGEVTTFHGVTSIRRTVKAPNSVNTEIRDHLATIGAKKLGK